MTGIRENLRRGRSHLIIAGTLAIFGPIIIAIEDRELQEQAGKAPPEHGGLIGAVGGIQRSTGGSAAAEKPPTAAVPVAKAASTPLSRQLESPAQPAAWEVQLGAYAHERDAQRHLAAVRASMPSLAGATATVAPGGDYLRLRLGGYATREQAASQCVMIRNAGFDCFVPPRP